MAASPTIAQLRAFITVAETGHFGHAADLLQMSQPAVSIQIRGLEAALGVTVFERLPRGVTLTEEGRALIPHARLALGSIDDMVRSAGSMSGQIGQLRIGAIPTMAPYLLPTVVATLRQSRPGVEVRLTEHRTSNLIPRLHDHEIDLGLLALPVDDPALDTVAIADDPFYLAVPQDDPLAGRTGLELSAIAALDVLLLEDGHCLRGQTEEVCRLAGVGRTIDVGSASLATVCQMVAGGLGITLLPASAAELEARPGNGIALAAFKRPAPKRVITMAFHRKSRHADELREIAQSMRGVFAFTRWGDENPR